MHQQSFFNWGFSWLANNSYRKVLQKIKEQVGKNEQKEQREPQIDKDTELQNISYEELITNNKKAIKIAKKAAKELCTHAKDVLEQIALNMEIKRSLSKTRAQKNQELLCPICLDFMNGPVLTSCSHSFCHMCLDESILNNENCPVCRKKIRPEQFLKVKTLETIIQKEIISYELSQVERYVDREADYQQWLKKRTIDFDKLKVNDKLDVRDTEHVWCKAHVMKIFEPTKFHPEKRILVHYEGWSNLYDEIIPVSSFKLANANFYTSRQEIPHYQPANQNQQRLRAAIVRGQQAQFNDNIDNMMNIFGPEDSQQSEQSEEEEVELGQQDFQMFQEPQILQPVPQQQGQIHQDQQPVQVQDEQISLHSGNEEQLDNFQNQVQQRLQLQTYDQVAVEQQPIEQIIQQQQDLIQNNPQSNHNSKQQVPQINENGFDLMIENRTGQKIQQLGLNENANLLVEGTEQKPAQKEEMVYQLPQQIQTNNSVQREEK